MCPCVPVGGQRIAQLSLSILVNDNDTHLCVSSRKFGLWVGVAGCVAKFVRFLLPFITLLIKIVVLQGIRRAKSNYNPLQSWNH